MIHNARTLCLSTLLVATVAASFLQACSADRQMRTTSSDQTSAPQMPSGGECDPAIGGTWDPPIETPDVLGVHTTLLKSGKVLLFGPDPIREASTSASSVRIFDPLTSAPPVSPFAADADPNLFCAGQTTLSDGRVLIVGGSGDELTAVHTVDPMTGAFTAHAKMAMGRWYPTVAAMPQNKAFVISGSTFGPVTPMNNTFQIFDGQTGMGFQKEVPKPFSDDEATIGMYPFVHLLPSGLLAVHSNRSTRLFDPTNEQWLPDVFTTLSPAGRTYPKQGASVVLPLDADATDAELMVLGGGGAYDFVENGGIDPDAFGVPSQSSVESIHFGAAEPKWQPRAPMNVARVMPDAVLLPDGSVLVVGGSSEGFATGHAAKPVLAPESFDPKTDTWKTLCPMTVPRLYHGSAILLPDARVLVAGHNAGNNPAPFDVSQTRVEIFNPPYLSKGPRPSIQEAPGTITYGSSHFISATGAAIESAMLIRPGAATHSNDMSQRAIKLGITPGPSPNVVMIHAPATSNIAPEGPYMLFVVSPDGVPSIAKLVEVAAP